MIDERGRLFGKVNLIDAAVAALFLLLIPIAYGAYGLFRVPPPQIVTVEPATLHQGETLSVKINGRDLRPFLRAVVGTDLATFLIQSPTLAEVKLPKLAAGAYDLILYDESREVARQPHAVTILPPPLPPAPPSFVVQVLGKFVGLEKATLPSLAIGSKLAQRVGGPDVAEVLALEATEPAVQGVRINPTTVIPTPLPGKVQVPAILRVRCTLASDVCKIGDTPVAREVSLSLFRATEEVRFIVDEIRAADAPAAFPLTPPVFSVFVQARGKFADMSAAVGGTIKIGTRFPKDAAAPIAEVLAVQTAEPAMQRVRVGSDDATTPIAGKVQVPAILRLRCALDAEGCKVGGTVTIPNAMLSLQRGREDAVKFLVEEVRSAEAPIVFPSGRMATADLLVRFVVRPEVFSLVKIGDKAVSAAPLPVGGRPRETAALLTLGKEQTLRSLVSIELDPNPNQHQVEQQVIAFEASVRAQVQDTPAGWRYDGRVLKIGAVFSFDTTLYVMRGWILRILPPSSRAE